MPASHPLSAQKATIHAWPIVVDVADVEMPSDSPPSATSGKRSSSSQTVMPRSGCGSGPARPHEEVRIAGLPLTGLRFVIDRHGSSEIRISRLVEATPSE